MKKKYLFILLIFLSILVYFFFHLDFFKNETSKTLKLNNSKISKTSPESTYKSNIMNDVTFSSIDLNGNKYIITSEKAESDIENRNILYLTNVKAVIELDNSNKIRVTSNYGKYNSLNYDTIFSKNVIIDYSINQITSDYLDFSFGRNSMIISKNIFFTNSGNILKADVIEIDIKTKDTRIYMFEDKKKVNIKNKD